MFTVSPKTSPSRVSTGPRARPTRSAGMGADSLSRWIPMAAIAADRGSPKVNITASPRFLMT